MKQVSYAFDQLIGSSSGVLRGKKILSKKQFNSLVKGWTFLHKLKKKTPKWKGN